MLDDKEKSRLQNLSDADKRLTIADECSRIHCAVNDGSLDRDSVNDALERIGVLNAEPALDEPYVSSASKPAAQPDSPPAGAKGSVTLE